MIAFELTTKLSHNGSSRGQLQDTQAKRDDGRSSFPCPTLEYWSMGCCGIGTFHHAGNLSYLQKEELSSFFDWLDLQKGPGGWIPREWIFSVADHQRGILQHVLEHPKVKQIDSFLNKSHGPSRIFVYRYSGQKDFS